MYKARAFGDTGWLSAVSSTRPDADQGLELTGHSVVPLSGTPGRSGVVAAVHADDLTGDVARVIGAQEGGGGGDVLRNAQPADWAPRGHLVDHLFAGWPLRERRGHEHGSDDGPGRDRVDGDPVLA